MARKITVTKFEAGEHMGERFASYAIEAEGVGQVGSMHAVYEGRAIVGYGVEFDNYDFLGGRENARVLARECETEDTGAGSAAARRECIARITARLADR